MNLKEKLQNVEKELEQYSNKELREKLMKLYAKSELAIEPDYCIEKATEIFNLMQSICPSGIYRKFVEIINKHETRLESIK